MPDGSASAHLYRPKLVSLASQNYNLESFRCDVVAALTVAIVALPLSMAIAVASGVPPERGLYAAIVGGFVVSALGGSRFQIGGPAGAFIVLVAATVTRFGIEGLLLTVFLSGLLLTVMGFLRLGALIRHIPHAVTVGFTCGIAVTIFATQLKELGIDFGGKGLQSLLSNGFSLSGIHPVALAIGVLTAATIFALQTLRPGWPGMLVALVGATCASTYFGLSTETIGSRFGEIPSHLPLPALPPHSWTSIIEVLPTVLSFTLLGGIESLLSAKIADEMTGRKHRHHMELVAQGIANIASALFGGISVTGTIARTATNIGQGPAVRSLASCTRPLSECFFVCRSLDPPCSARISCRRPGRGVLEHDREGTTDRARSPLAFGDRAGIDLRPDCRDRPDLRHHRRVCCGDPVQSLGQVCGGEASDLTQINERRRPRLILTVRETGARRLTKAGECCLISLAAAVAKRLAKRSNRWMTCRCGKRYRALPMTGILNSLSSSTDRVHPVIFACRRTPSGWVRVPTLDRVAINPTHWRVWPTKS